MAQMQKMIEQMMASQNTSKETDNTSKEEQKKSPGRPKKTT